MSKRSDRIGPFVMLSKDYIRNYYSLSRSEMLLVSTLLFFAHGDSPTVWPGYRKISEFTRMGSATISRAIKKLEKRGWLKVKRTRYALSEYTLLYPDALAEEFFGKPVAGDEEDPRVLSRRQQAVDEMEAPVDEMEADGDPECFHHGSRGASTVEARSCQDESILILLCLSVILTAWTSRNDRHVRQKNRWTN